MLRSTKKEVKEKIRAYILDCMDFSNYIEYEGYPDKEPDAWQDRIIFCRDIFRAEYVNTQNLLRYGGERGCFREWLCGLPSVLSIDYSYFDVRQIAAGMA